MTKRLFCSICYMPRQHGHDAEPVNSGRCCEHCHKTVVEPARIAECLRDHPELTETTRQSLAVRR